jgi:uncharacterized membrane protein
LTTGQSSSGVEPRVASLLCYSAWWLTGLIFLLVEREHRGVRFHAAQSVLLFGAVTALLVLLGGASALALVVSSAGYRTLQALSNLIWLGAAAVWLVLMLRAWRGDTWRLPVVAGLADRIARRGR